MPWRRKWQPTPVFLSDKFHGQRSLLGYSPWGHKESDMTLVTKQPQHHYCNVSLTFTESLLSAKQASINATATRLACHSSIDLTSKEINGRNGFTLLLSRRAKAKSAWYHLSQVLGPSRWHCIRGTWWQMTHMLVCCCKRATALIN